MTLTYEQYILRNLKFIYENILGAPALVLMLGSEIEYVGENAEFANHAKRQFIHVSMTSAKVFNFNIHNSFSILISIPPPSVSGTSRNESVPTLRVVL